MGCEKVLLENAEVVKEIELLDKWRFKDAVVRRTTGAHVQYFDGYKFKINGKWYIHSTKDNSDVIHERKTVYISVWKDEYSGAHFAVSNQVYSGADKVFILAGKELEYYCSICYS